MADHDSTATFELPVRMPGFLSAGECRDLLAEIDTADHEQVQVWQDDGWSTRSDSRRGAIAVLRDETEIFVQDRLWEVMPALEQRYRCAVSHLSGVTALIYGEGDHFATHVDGGGDDADAPSEVRRRRVSLVIALNNGGGGATSFAGGELHLYPTRDPEQIVVRSRPGLLVAFPSALAHRVTPVIRGRRYSLALWALAPEG